MPKLDIKHLGLKKQSFDGIFRGVIEDNNDPDKLGRVKARIFGIHDSSKIETKIGGIPTEKLPWAEPCFGLMEGSMSGYGSFGVPLKGSHVFIFFENSNWECPRYFATAAGKPSEGPDKTKGFNDPDGQYPSKIGESDIHRLARNENVEETIVQFKKDNKMGTVGDVNGGSWSEPDPAYAAQYPHNTVIATHSGIVIELDNTPNNVRIHAFHPSGSFIEIDKDGNVVFKNSGTRYDIIKGANYKTSSEEHMNVQNDSGTIVGGDRILEVVGDDTTTIGQNRVDTILQNFTQQVGGSVTQEIGESWSIRSNGDINIESGGNVTISAKGTLKLIGARVDLNPEPPKDVTVEIEGEVIMLQGEQVNTTWVEIVEDNYIDFDYLVMPATGVAGVDMVYPVTGITPDILDTGTTGAVQNIIFNAITINEVNGPNELNPNSEVIETDIAYPNPTESVPAYTGGITLPSDYTTIDYTMKLSKNFSLRDLCLPNGNGVKWPIKQQTVKQKIGGVVQSYVITPEEIVDNLARLCTDVLEPLNSKFDGLRINSGFRHSSFKSTLSSATSNHNWGNAADISWYGLSDRGYFERAKWIKDNLPTWVELILEYGGKDGVWIHIASQRAVGFTPQFPQHYPYTVHVLNNKANGNKPIYENGLTCRTNIPNVGGKPWNGRS